TLSFTFSLQAPPPPELYTLSLHVALPISSAPLPHCAMVRKPAMGKVAALGWTDAQGRHRRRIAHRPARGLPAVARGGSPPLRVRSEEHTSELQSRFDLVCRLLLEKKKASQ